MAKFYVDAIYGSDVTGDGTLKYPYATLDQLVANNTFVEDTIIILKTGDYILNPSLISKIPTNTTLTVEGYGNDTNLLVGGSAADWTDPGVLGAKFKLIKLKMNFINFVEYAVTTGTSGGGGTGTRYWNWWWYFMIKPEFEMHNVLIANLTHTTSSNHNVINLYFFRNSEYSKITMYNCTTYNCTNTKLIENIAYKATIEKCYGNFTGDFTNINSVIKTPELDAKYYISNIDENQLKIGVYHGLYSWYFTNFLILMNNTYYSIKNEFYNQTLKMYRPITKEELQIYGFERYAISDMGEFAQKEVVLGEEISRTSPTMTSNILPSPYVITASSQYDTTNYLPWKAFNNTNANSTDCWITVSGTKTGWLQVKLDSAKKVNSFAIASRYTADATASPKDFSLQASNDGTTFIDLTTITGETGWGTAETRTYKFINEDEYQYYRLNITANNGQTYTCVAELGLYYTTPLIEKFTPIDKFDNFRIVADTNNIIKIHGLKSTRELIVASGDITISMAKNISYFLLDANENKDAQNNKIGEVRIVYSTDKGVTWYTSEDGINPVPADVIIPVMMYNLMADEEKVWCQAAKDTIAQIGMTVEMFNNFDFNVVDEYGIRFAYVLTRPSYADTAETKQLTWAFDKKGYMKELKDAEYDVDVYNHTVVLTSNITNELIQLSVLA